MHWYKIKLSIRTSTFLQIIYSLIGYLLRSADANNIKDPAIFLLYSFWPVLHTYGAKCIWPLCTFQPRNTNFLSAKGLFATNYHSNSLIWLFALGSLVRSALLFPLWGNSICLFCSSLVCLWAVVFFRSLYPICSICVYIAEINHANCSAEQIKYSTRTRGLIIFTDGSAWNGKR